MSPHSKPAFPTLATWCNGCAPADLRTALRTGPRDPECRGLGRRTRHAPWCRSRCRECLAPPRAPHQPRGGRFVGPRIAQQLRAGIRRPRKRRAVRPNRGPRAARRHRWPAWQIARAQLDHGHVERVRLPGRKPAPAIFPRAAGRIQVTQVLAKGQRGRRRFVDDIEHVQAGHLAGVGGGLAARAVKVDRHGDDNLNGRAQGRHDVVLQLAQNARLNDFRRQILAPNRLRIRGLPHVAFDALGHPIVVDAHGHFLASLPTTTSPSSKSTTLGVKFPWALRTMTVPRFVDASHRRIGGAQVDSNGIGLGHAKRPKIWAALAGRGKP